jgi:hypothetical protein
MGLFRKKKEKPVKVKIEPTLTERPKMTKVLQAVDVIVPQYPKKARQKALDFLAAVEGAYLLRAKDEAEVVAHREQGGLVVERLLGKGERELRYRRHNRERATIYCDARELENLTALGLIKQVEKS